MRIAALSFAAGGVIGTLLGIVAGTMGLELDGTKLVAFVVAISIFYGTNGIFVGAFFAEQTIAKRTQPVP